MTGERPDRRAADLDSVERARHRDTVDRDVAGEGDCPQVGSVNRSRRVDREARRFMSLEFMLAPVEQRETMLGKQGEGAAEAMFEGREQREV